MGAQKDTHLNDPDFLKQLRNRDPDAISKLVTTYTEHLFKGALGLGFDDKSAEELVQRVWVTFFDVVVTFEGRSHIRTFLFGVMYNKASELRREDKRHGNTDPIDETMESKFTVDGSWSQTPIDPERFMASTQMMELIQKCIDNLPFTQRMAFCLKEIHEEGSQEICKILEVSNTNLGVLLYRARNRLRECIESKS